MIPSFIITFRETLEAALVIGVILSYLVKIQQVKYNNIVYIGVVSGIIASIVSALLFTNAAGGFTGRTEEIFEGITMLLGACLLTTMILWMIKQKHVATELEHKVAIEIAEAHKFGLFSLVFISVLREGIETVIFLKVASFVSTNNNLIGGLAGIIGAIILGYTIFIGSIRISIKKFFNVTSILLILFATGLVAHGVHELQEANILPTIIEHLWDINPSLHLDGSFPLLHEKGEIGSILNGLFGYNGNPSLIEVISSLGYLLLVCIFWRNITSQFPSFSKIEPTTESL
ncbi:MAG: FTR1 family protein [Nitrospirota bacterium]